MSSHEVVIAGGGPTGLMLAGELALAGVHVAVVERRASQEVDGSRAGGLHSRTIEALDQRGIAERFLAEGKVVHALWFAGVSLDISDFPTRHNYLLALRQHHFERILAGWVEELGVPILRGLEVAGFAQDDTGITVELSGGRPLRAEYLVGCDGGRSLVRKTAAIEFAGRDPSTSWLIAEVEMDDEPQLGMRREGGGIGRAEGGAFRVVLTERDLNHTREATLQDVREALIAAYGTDFRVHTPSWISRFTDMTRQAAAYRKGRVLLAGDAAHVHPPQGGQGLNIGVQDAVNLGWKLAQVVRRISPESLLDTYHTERHPVAACVLRNTKAMVALRRTDELSEALGEIVDELLVMDEPRRRLAGMMSGLDILYDAGKGHPLLGRRMPDLDLITANGPVRVFALLHDAKPVLLKLGDLIGAATVRERLLGQPQPCQGAPRGTDSFDITPWADRVQSIDASYAAPWELPVIGKVTAPTAVLIRPDGYVAWVGDSTQLGLADALTTWFGSPAVT